MNIGDAYRTYYNNQRLKWMVDNRLYKGVKLDGKETPALPAAATPGGTAQAYGGPMPVVGLLADGGHMYDGKNPDGQKMKVMPVEEVPSWYKQPTVPGMAPETSSTNTYSLEAEVKRQEAVKKARTDREAKERMEAGKKSQAYIGPAKYSREIQDKINADVQQHINLQNMVAQTVSQAASPGRIAYGTYSAGRNAALTTAPFALAAPAATLGGIAGGAAVDLGVAGLSGGQYMDWGNMMAGEFGGNSLLWGFTNPGYYLGGLSRFNVGHPLGYYAKLEKPNRYYRYVGRDAIEDANKTGFLRSSRLYNEEPMGAPIVNSSIPLLRKTFDYMMFSKDRQWNGGLNAVKGNGALRVIATDKSATPNFKWEQSNIDFNHKGHEGIYLPVENGRKDLVSTDGFHYYEPLFGNSRLGYNAGISRNRCLQVFTLGHGIQSFLNKQDATTVRSCQMRMGNIKQ